MHTTRISDYLFQTAATVGAEPELVQDEPKTKVIKNNSKGVKAK